MRVELGSWRYDVGDWFGMRRGWRAGAVLFRVFGGRREDMVEGEQLCDIRE